MMTAIISQFDKTYFPYSILFLKTLKKTKNQKFSIYFYTFGLSVNQKKKLYSIYPKLKIINDSKYNMQKKRTRDYLSNLKVKIFHKAINEKIADHYLFFDIDIAFTKSFNIKDIISKNKILLIFRDGSHGSSIYFSKSKKHLRINSSIISIPKKHSSFLTLWHEIALSKKKMITTKNNKKSYIRNGEYFWDQITLDLAQKSSDISFGNIDYHKFLNNLNYNKEDEFLENIFIYSCHHFDENNKLELFKKYLYFFKVSV